MALDVLGTLGALDILGVLWIMRAIGIIGPDVGQCRAMKDVWGTKLQKCV